MYVPFYPALEAKMQGKRVSFVIISISLHQISDIHLRVNFESEEVAKGEAESTLQFNL